ncbi:MAG TPA: DUF192 domain-containing protein [Patescibacteria group bacterium]|nr:DUF192 domain-containing protein [Patescibacteria group bacterium]
MKKTCLLLVAVGLVAASCNSSNQLRQDEVIQIKSRRFSVQLADTPQEREQGLSGIAAISDEEGMLFLFSGPQSPQFWMKDMNFPLDLVWINGDKIVGITDNVPTQPKVPDSQLATYAPPSPVDKVLEVNAGWALRKDVNVGDTITVVSQ